MNAADEIQAAIGVLTDLTRRTTPGPWNGWRQYDPLRGTQFGIEARDVPVAKVYTIEDTDLIERLHRTIRVQLAILREAISYEDGVGIDDDDTALTLARAINGAAS